MRKTKKDRLTVFFAAKSHKVDCPLRAIVAEKGTWQHLVGQYLQRWLNTLVISDPFSVTSSDCVVDFLREKQPVANSAFSVDIEELFYSVPHAELFLAVRELIEENGAVSFQNACGVSVDSFLQLLSVYLSSTFVEFADKLFVQKNRICIGSSVAPVLCHIFLSKFDNALSSTFVDGRVVKVFRYVDFLIL